MSPLFISPFVGSVVLCADLAAALATLEAPLTEEECTDLDVAILASADFVHEVRAATLKLVRDRAAALRAELADDAELLTPGERQIRLAADKA